MLDKGFENDIRQIIEKTATSADRQTLMCMFDFASAWPDLTISQVSATWPESIRRLASTFLKDPVRVTVGKDELTANSRVEQGGYSFLA